MQQGRLKAGPQSPLKFRVTPEHLRSCTAEDISPFCHKLARRYSSVDHAHLCSLQHGLAHPSIPVLSHGPWLFMTLWRCYRCIANPHPVSRCDWKAPVRCTEGSDNGGVFAGAYWERQNRHRTRDIMARWIVSQQIPPVSSPLLLFCLLIDTRRDPRSAVPVVTGTFAVLTVQVCVP